ncbi:hypothetical protein Lalb_Chr15g0081411 [Lupinus albus]|uniref:Uncharacterized protein n=1 Tax=Lupinus albus TaxID=3870 RepID=A0A6A4PEC6_LUPAL|nr:hypothetical protein Lalb_Chr15g0081411 [Lupinus albus]
MFLIPKFLFHFIFYHDSLLLPRILTIHATMSRSSTMAPFSPMAMVGFLLLLPNHNGRVSSSFAIEFEVDI